jgi:hypothetical protein
MSSEVTITITAFDEATETINNVANAVDQANTEITDSSAEMSSTVQEANVSVKDTALGFNNMATSGMMLYMAVNNVENAQVALDRAHLQVEKSTNAVTSAQNAYNTAVEKYGPNSKEAQDALAKLKTAQDGLVVAQERADEAQRNYNNTIAFSVMSVIPSLITMVTSAATVMPALSTAVDGISGALDFLAANPIVLVIAGIAALVMGLIYAYNNCKPFRDAVNDIASVLAGVFAAAIHAITDALGWLWNNVLLPITTAFRILWDALTNNPILAIVTGPIGIMIFALSHWQDIVKTVSDGLAWFWNNVLAPLGAFLKTVFGDAISFIINLFQKLWDIIKPLVDAINTVKDVMGGFVKDISGALGAAGNAIGGFISSICFAHALAAAAANSAKTMSGWASMLKENMEKGLGHIKDFNAQAGIMTGVSPGLGAAGAVSAVAAAGRPSAVNVYHTGPMVNVQGSADKLTAQLAAQMVQAQLKNVIIEPTSAASPVRKRVRFGYNQ